jgi:hypothetical protein
LKILRNFLLLILVSCQNFKPDSINVQTYPEIDTVLKSQIELLQNSNLQKEVWLNGEGELQELKMDSLGWVKELSFLDEINPNLPEYVGAFDVIETDTLLVLKLGEKESGSLTEFARAKHNDEISYLIATIHEDKDIYIHHKKIYIAFIQNKLSEYYINGYQKILYKDSITFRIEGKVIQ